MKDQVLMSPKNGALCVGIPLFKIHHFETVTQMADYQICALRGEPIAYVLDMGDVAPLVSAEWVHSQLINLGEL